MKTEHEVMREAICKYPDNANKAVEWALSKCMSYKALRAKREQDVWRGHLRKISQHMMGMTRSVMRNQRLHEVMPFPKRSDSVIGKLAEVATKNILTSWKMYDGRSLGEMKGAELLSIAQTKESKAQTEILDARFYMLLAKKTPPKSKVKNYVTDSEAYEMLNKAKEEVKIFV